MNAQEAHRKSLQVLGAQHQNMNARALELLPAVLAGIESAASCGTFVYRYHPTSVASMRDLLEAMTLLLQEMGYGVLCDFDPPAYIECSWIHAV